MIRPILLRRPPQSNYPPDAVPDPDHGSGLGPRHEKGGISRLTPPQLAPRLQSLPPILHNPYQSSTSSCSKGPRGLSVLMQLTSIFTRTSISPGLWLRQWESRYAIRAGRNFVVIPSFEGDRLCLHLCRLSMILEGSYPRLPLGFIRLASRTISCNPIGVRLFSSRHSIANVCEQLEVLLLAGKQWIRLEMRND